VREKEREGGEGVKEIKFKGEKNEMISHLLSTFSFILAYEMEEGEDVSEEDGTLIYPNESVSLSCNWMQHF